MHNFFFLDYSKIKLETMIILLTLTSLLLLILLAKLSEIAKYYIKYAAYSLCCVLMTCFAGIFCLFHPGNSENVKIAQFFTKLMNVEWMFGFKIEVLDYHNILNAQQPFVIISNHQTIIDTIFVMQVPPKGAVPIAKKSLFYVPIFGQVLWLFGTIFIDRKRTKSAVEIMKKVACEINKRKTPVWIFPEGSRYQCDKIMPFRKGAFHLAIQAQVPLVPVVIGNYRNVIDCHNKSFNGGVIRVKCLPAIKTTNLTVDDVDDLAKTAYKIMSEEFEKDCKVNSDVHFSGK